MGEYARDWGLVPNALALSSGANQMKFVDRVLTLLLDRILRFHWIVARSSSVSLPTSPFIAGEKGANKASQCLMTRTPLMRTHKTTKGYTGIYREPRTNQGGFQEDGKHGERLGS